MGIRRPDFFRGLMQGEIKLARDVFHETLPRWIQIGVTNGLNPKGGPWTVDRSWGDILQGEPNIGRTPLKYLIGFGDDASKDLSIADPAVLMHEMTHVWQYYHLGSSALTGLRCLYAQELGAGYEYTAGDAWCNYNMEQQAMIVEDWTRRGQKKDDELFPYIHFLIRREGEYRPPKRIVQGIELDELCMMKLAELKPLIVHEPVVQQYPVPIQSKNDSFVRIPGDSLFEFDHFDLKPEAAEVLRKAATTILGSASAIRRVSRIHINGHTDTVGGGEYNMDLSRKRAESVARWFSSHGYFPHSIMSVEGFGKSQPIPGKADKDNRRVEIYVSYE